MSRTFIRAIWLSSFILLFGILLPPDARAEGIDFRSELTFSSTDSKNTNKTTGEKIKTDSHRFDQLYDVDMRKTIFPYLIFSAGTIFELNKTESKTEGSKVKVDERILRPFVRLNLENPLYRAGVSYNRIQRNQKTTGVPNTEDIRDEINSVLNYRPADLPRVQLRYSRVHTYDDPETVDDMVQTLTVDSDYNPWEELRLDYVYTRIDTDDRLENFDTLEQTHFGRVEYSHNFLDGRLYLNTSYRIRHNTLEFTGTGTGEVPVQRAQGLFSLDTTPQDGPALQVNNALIDGNVTVSAGIDIGLGGDETTLTNIGLDFGFEVRVDQVRIWVDRRLSDSVANSFSWEIYTSPDNTDSSTWTLLTTVSPADFGPFDNRFEIPFPPVNTRFIKVVTTPLSPTVPDSSSFPNIFVTEMEVLVSVSAQEVNEVTTVDQNYDLSLRTKVSDKTFVGYTFNFTSRDQDPTDQKKTQLSNDIYANHVFNRIFSASARVSRTDTRENGEDTVTHTYSAILRGAYLPTFDQTLTMSGRNVNEEEDSSDNFSIILRNNARLYRGWSAFVDSGFDWNRPSGSNEVYKSILIRAGTDVEPNRKLTFNMNYQLRKFVDPEQPSEYQYDLDVFYLPLSTLSLNARFSVVERQQGPTRTLQNYVANWSPFPDGSLQFFFTYSETLRSEGNQRQRTLGPGLNWTIGPHFFLEMFYNMVKDDSDTQKIESNTFLANLRIRF